MCFLGLHDWRDVHTHGVLIFQECRRCKAHRRYGIGYGPLPASWTYAELDELQAPRDDRARLRVLLGADGMPTGLTILANGRLSPEALTNMRQTFDAWVTSGKSGIMFEESAEVRYEFVTVEQLTQSSGEEQ